MIYVYIISICIYTHICLSIYIHMCACVYELFSDMILQSHPLLLYCTIDLPNYILVKKDRILVNVCK